MAGPGNIGRAKADGRTRVQTVEQGRVRLKRVVATWDTLALRR